MFRRLPVKTRLLLMAALLVGTGLLWRQTRHLNTAPPSPAAPSPPADLPPEPPTPPPPGDTLLKDYAQPHTSPEDDLQSISHVLTNFALLTKGTDPIPLGSNEELTDALTGQRPQRPAFLSPHAPAVNDRGQLVDRWQSPLFFHASDRTRIDIRSAGPDGVMWTPDDLHRQHDGQYLRGPRLNPASLYPPFETP